MKILIGFLFCLYLFSCSRKSQEQQYFQMVKYEYIDTISHDTMYEGINVTNVIKGVREHPEWTGLYPIWERLKKYGLRDTIIKY